MNRKGFTLIELLAVIVLIGILSILIVSGLLSNVEEVRKTSYNTLINNIVTSSQMYYEECEYGNLSDTKYGIYACSITNNTIETTLGSLANTGFLKVSDSKEDAGKEIKIVINPIDNKDISDCKVQIIKEVNTSIFKVTYKIENIDTKDICPTTYQ